MNVKPKLKVHIKPNKRIETPEAIVYAPSPKLTWLQIFTSAAQIFLALLPISALLGGVIIYFYLNKYGLGSLYAEFIKDIDVWIITSAIYIVLFICFYAPGVLIFLFNKNPLFPKRVNFSNKKTKTLEKSSKNQEKNTLWIDCIKNIGLYIFFKLCKIFIFFIIAIILIYMIYEGFIFFLDHDITSLFLTVILISSVVFVCKKFKMDIVQFSIVYMVALYCLFLIGLNLPEIAIKLNLTEKNEKASHLFKMLGVEEDKDTYSWYKVSDTFTKKLNHREIQYLKDKFLLPAQPIIKNKQKYKQYWQFSGFDNSIYIYGNMRISTPNIKILCPMKGYIINEKNEITRLYIPYSKEVGTHCMRFQKDDLLKVEEYLKVP